MTDKGKGVLFPFLSWPFQRDFDRLSVDRRYLVALAPQELPPKGRMGTVLVRKTSGHSEGGLPFFK